MLTEETLQALQKSCTWAALTWDSHVQIEQDDSSVLHFKLVDPDGDIKAYWLARPCGHVNGCEIFTFRDAKDVDREFAYAGTMCTLVPNMIVGLMGL